MTLFTLPTSYGISQSWDMDFKVLHGVYYPNGFYASIGWHGHNGIDYRCPSGTPVEAVCDGIIEYVGPGNNHPLLSGGGNTVLLRNDELGIRFEYLHLSQQNVYTGQKVKRGQVIALSGNTGISSGSHLHLGAIPVRPNLNNGYRGRVDPTGWLYGPSNPDYAGLAAAGTIQPTDPKEFDLSQEQFDTIIRKLDAVIGTSHRSAEVAQATEDRGDSAKIALLLQLVTNLDASFRFIKVADNATLYEVEAGVARGISLAEWQAKGGQEPRIVEQWILDGLLVPAPGQKEGE